MESNQDFAYLPSYLFFLILDPSYLFFLILAPPQRDSCLSPDRAYLTETSKQIKLPNFQLSVDFCFIFPLFTQLEHFAFGLRDVNSDKCWPFQRII